MSKRTLLRIGLAAPLVLGALVALPAAANATDKQCGSLIYDEYYCAWFQSAPGQDTVEFEIIQNPDSGDLEATVSMVTGGARHELWALAYLKQCRGNGSACGAVASAAGGPVTADSLNVSPNLYHYAAGHIYFACGSAKDETENWNILNVCETVPIAN